MNKKEFMQKLKDNLMGLNQNDKREVLLDYEEHFLDGKNQGRSEEEICKALGDPREIAKEIKDQSQQGAPNNDGVNMAGYIIGIILLSAACLGLASILFSVITGAISGIFGAVVVATVFSNPFLIIAAVSAIVLAIAIFVLIALAIIKLIPMIIKWYKQMVYSLDNKPEKAKNVESKRIKIHALVWILVGVLCIASICGIIVGSVGFAKEMSVDFDAEDMYEFRELIREISSDHRDYERHSNESMENFEEEMEEFAQDMEEFADEMEDKYGDYDGWFFGWRYIFED